MKTTFRIALVSQQPLALIILFGFSLSQAEGNLITNLTPVADTALRNGASADTSSGIAAVLPVGVSSLGSTINHGLIKFPTEAIPANATVTQATLQITATSGNASTANYNLFRALKDWNETSTTWNTRLSPAIGWGILGGAAGVDYVASASATAPVSVGTGNVFTSAGMLVDVQLWQNDPGTNFGWFLIAVNEQPGSGKLIASREDTLQTPVLSVTYTLPATPSAPILINPALVNTSFQFSFNAVSNHAHTVEFSDSLSPTNWITLTNIVALPADTLIHITNNASATERYFRVGVQ